MTESSEEIPVATSAKSIPIYESHSQRTKNVEININNLPHGSEGLSSFYMYQFLNYSFGQRLSRPYYVRFTQSVINPKPRKKIKIRARTMRRQSAGWNGFGNIFLLR